MNQEDIIKKFSKYDKDVLLNVFYDFGILGDPDKHDPENPCEGIEYLFYKLDQAVKDKKRKLEDIKIELLEKEWDKALENRSKAHSQFCLNPTQKNLSLKHSAEDTFNKIDRKLNKLLRCHENIKKPKNNLSLFNVLEV